jgi:hypothetical protein
MSKVFQTFVIPIIVVVVVMLAIQQTSAQTLVQLPNELKVLVGLFVTFLVVEGEKVLGKALGFDLTGKFAMVAAALTTLVVVFTDSLLALIPAQYESIANLILQMIIAMVAAYGLHRTAQRAFGAYRYDSVVATAKVE